MGAGLPPRTPAELRQIYAGEIAEHRGWLRGFEAWRLIAWAGQLARQAESAIFEALVGRLLRSNATQVEPGEDRKRGGPDFRCDGGAFFVEATCISMASATEATGLSDRGFEGGAVGGLDGRLGGEIQAKVRQAAKSPTAPTLVAVGTLHYQASVICFEGPRLEWLLVGEPVILVPLSRNTGSPTGSTRIEHDIDSTPFMILGGDAGTPVGTWRRDVSGALLLGAGSLAVGGSGDALAGGATGLLHPDPLRPFDRALLPGIRFLRLGEGWRTGRAVCEEV